jgi:simple sugar transport system permease protein
MATRPFAESLHLSRLLPPSTLNTSIIVALAASVVLFVFLFRSSRGYELRLVGGNETFARYIGVPTGRVTIGTMALSGALHGLAGALMVLGTHHAAVGGMSQGIGWNAIAVALVARVHPVAAIAAAAIFSYLEAGARASMLHTQFTFELGTIVQGVIFLLVTASVTWPALRGARRGGGTRGVRHGQGTRRGRDAQHERGLLRGRATLRGRSRP